MRLILPCLFLGWISVTTSLSITYPTCLDGWGVTDQNLCYWFSGDNAYTWPQCNDYCNSINASMLCIENADQQDTVWRYNSGYAWIGLSDVANPGTYEWNSGCSSTYTNYGAIEGSDYILIDGGAAGQWNDFPGTAPSNCACQLDATMVTVPAICPEGWIVGPFGCSYRILDPLLTWDDCNTNCATRNVSMLCIHTSSENDHFSSLYYGTGLWLGLSDTATEGTFVWNDGCNTLYQNWRTWDGEPNNAGGNEDYVTLYTGGFGDWGSASTTDNCVCQSDFLTYDQIPDPNFCPEGWLIGETGCYYVHRPSNTFTVSPTGCASQCSGLGGTMLCIQNQTQNDLIQSLYLSGDNVYIGYTDTAVEGTFEWFAGCDSTYTNWNSAGGEPNNFNGDEDYSILVVAAGLWNDVSHFDINGYCACQSDFYIFPTSQPSSQPSSQPFSSPSSLPSAQPTTQPTTYTAARLDWYVTVGDQGTTTIAVGDTVKWTWTDSNAHTVRSTAAGFNSGSMTSGSFSYTFNTVGTFPYDCELHPSMQGVIEVVNHPTMAPTAEPTYEMRCIDIYDTVLGACTDFVAEDINSYVDEKTVTCA
eukprot:CAMPEP_0174989778 /NCGR_PEP_ID=MMETSP0004_2-20121128/20924_1 /TAXON_ID=420556 /ORGANISM="Ochromonas sp., Strain CCMP1393" /LENGTH=586 /DNA_ID=CAMNT_0016243251 /DNA_START=85 /DNA_END=1846 /DNA_ORIENTATION=-